MPPSLITGLRSRKHRHRLAWAIALIPVVQVVPFAVNHLPEVGAELRPASAIAHADNATPHGPDWPGLSSVEVTEPAAPRTA